MNSIRLPDEVRILAADNDSGMRRILPVQAHEVFAVERQQAATLSDGEGEHFRIQNALIGISGIERGQDIMPQFTES